jgi:hypothetical protein
MSGTAALVDRAISLREAGDAVASAKLLAEILAEAPDHGRAYCELAVLRQEAGDLAGAAACLENALQHAGADARTSLFLAQMRYGRGDFAGGDAALAPLPPGPARDAMAAFGAYLRAFPLPRALAMLQELKRRHRYFDTAEIAAALHQAVRERAPFALVRLGDGEAAWIDPGAVDKADYSALYAQHRAQMAAIWFGADFAADATGFTALAKGLPERIAGWDVTGIPYSSWLRHEYTIASTRGIPSLVNLIRRLPEVSIPAQTVFCRQLANADLFTEGHLPGLLRRAGRVSVITCHTGLPGWLKAEYGLSDVELLPVPGERGRAEMLGAAALQGVQFPDRFTQLQEELARNWNGRLVLVAAGILGKFYASTIRRHGGIALDIGSLADVWMGRLTRPGNAKLIAKPISNLGT